jgi:hypothetical protein
MVGVVGKESSGGVGANSLGVNSEEFETSYGGYSSEGVGEDISEIA